MGKVLIFSAPSGSGKTTIVHRLLELYPQLEFSVSATSRAPRGQEQDGVDYYFLSQEAFREAVRAEAGDKPLARFKDTWYRYNLVAFQKALIAWFPSLPKPCGIFAANDADALVVVTEWEEFRLPSWQVIKKAMAGNVVIDGRNIYQPEDLVSVGLDYYNIGHKPCFAADYKPTEE